MRRSPDNIIDGIIVCVIAALVSGMARRLRWVAKYVHGEAKQQMKAYAALTPEQHADQARKDVRESSVGCLASLGFFTSLLLLLASMSSSRTTRTHMLGWIGLSALAGELAVAIYNPWKHQHPYSLRALFTIWLVACLFFGALLAAGVYVLPL
jgi:hypothetical protein